MPKVSGVQSKEARECVCSTCVHFFWKTNFQKFCRLHQKAIQGKGCSGEDYENFTDPKYMPGEHPYERHIKN